VCSVHRSCVSEECIREMIHFSYLFNLRAAFMGHPTGHKLVRGVKCVSQTTAWSPCSKSCGTGVSTRATSSNTQCKLVKETRICEVRPCEMAVTKLKVYSTFLFFNVPNIFCRTGVGNLWLFWLPHNFELRKKKLRPPPCNFLYRRSNLRSLFLKSTSLFFY